MIAFRARTYGIAISSGLAATDPTRVKVTEVIRQLSGTFSGLFISLQSTEI